MVHQATETVRAFLRLRTMHYHRENELEDTIYFSRHEEMFRKGLDCYNHDKVFPQLKLGDYGRSDLIGININHKHKSKKRVVDIYIYEIKRHFIDISSVHQISRYLFAIKKFLRGKYSSSKYSFNYHMVLVGYYIDTDRHFNFLCDAMNIKCYLYDLKETGLRFEKYSPSSFRHKDNEYDNFGDLDCLNLKEISLETYKEKIHLENVLSYFDKHIKYVNI